MTGYSCTLCGKGSNGEEFLRFEQKENNVTSIIYVCRSCVCQKGSAVARPEIYAVPSYQYQHQASLS